MDNVQHLNNCILLLEMLIIFILIEAYIIFPSGTGQHCCNVCAYLCWDHN
jgi:hypothetical protein